MKHKLTINIVLIIGLTIGAKYLISFFSSNSITDKGFTLNLYFLLYIFLAIVLQMIGHILRAYKSKLLLDNIRKANTRILFEGLSIGFLFNTILPFRLGEFVRAHFIGSKLSVSRTVVFMSIVIERIVDGVIIGFCFISAAMLIANTSEIASKNIFNIGIWIICISLIVIIGILAMLKEPPSVLKIIHKFSKYFNDNIKNKLRLIFWSGINGTRIMLKDRTKFGKYILISFLMWLIYFTSTMLLVFSVYSNENYKNIWYIIQSTYAGVTAPAGPGYIGTFHVIVSKLLNDLDLGNIDLYTIVAWLVIILPIALVGVVSLILNKYGTKTKIPIQKALINKLYRETDISSELSIFLDSYFLNERINKILTKAEINGNFSLIKSFKGGSNAQTMLVWEESSLRVKKITLSQYKLKLSEQAKWLKDRSDLNHIPNVINEDNAEQYYSYDLEYKENYYPMFDYIHSKEPKDSMKIIEKIIDFMKSHIYEKNSKKNYTGELRKYIEDKIYGKISDTAKLNANLNKLLAYKNLRINDKKYLNLLEIVNMIAKNENAMRSLSTYSETTIHGDLTIDNLLVSDENDFLIIDPNNENLVSNTSVDLGKIYQSLHSGYEFLIQQNSCVVKDNCINFEDNKSYKYDSIYKLLNLKLKKDMPKDEYNSIFFHEAVHYCRMLTYRANIDPATLPIYYAKAVILFNEYYKKL